MGTAQTTPNTPITQKLRALADEIRVQLHLAGMEAKESWAGLEPRLHAFERKAERAGQRVGRELDEIGQQLSRELSALRDRLSKR